LALAGCGGGGGGSETTATGTSTAASGQGATTGARKEGNSAKSEAPPRAPGPTAPDTSNLPAPTEGSKKAAPGVPTSKGGDNSIQTWGTEASAAERERVTGIVKAFLDARAAAEWAKACSYLAAKQLKEFEQLLRDSKKKGVAACGEAMGALAQGVRPGAFDDEAKLDYVLSLRLGEGYAFLIYTRSGSEKVYATALADENGTWKVVSVGPTVLGS
jgi:hypothetical protein